MDVKKTVKLLALHEGVSVAALVRRLSSYVGKDYSTQSFSNRLTKGTVHYNEVDKIAEMLGYEIKFEKKR